MTVIAIDCETWLIEPGLLAPPMVCLQWCAEGGAPRLVLAKDARRNIELWLSSYTTVLVGHNVAYDLAVIAAMWPDLIPAIFAKYDRDEISDTMLREQLAGIAAGNFRSYLGADGELHAVKYSLADCVARHFGRQMSKGEDTWRLRYKELDGIPIEQWPDAARDYALDDAHQTLALYEDQERRFGGLLADQYRQSRAAFALHLSSCWGLYTDSDAVDKLEQELQADFNDLQAELQADGLIREDGTANVAAAREAMIAACAEEGIPVLCTKKGAVSLAAETCARFDDTTTIGRYSHYLTVRKTLSNDIKMLRAGCDIPVQPRYDLADTGRTRAAKPNIQAINRGQGIREAFRPRPGTVFIQADFEGLELHCMAAWCLEVIGYSELAEALNAGRDVHTDMAASLLGMTYEEAMAQKKAGGKAVKEYRQRAKAVNFGFPGGLGAAKLVKYAKTSFGVNMTEGEAIAAKNAWLQRFPEFREYFRLASIATNNIDHVADEEHIFTWRKRGNVRYSALCNGRFQGLGADAAKEALWRVTRACYAETSSPLYGCRVVAFVHDEIIAECPTERCAPAAAELGRLMIEGANKYLGRVPVRLEPLAMTLWSKSAEPTYDANGVLIPWSPPAPAEVAVA